MDKVKEAVKKAAEAAELKKRAVETQVREMEETVRIVTNIQTLIDNGTFVGRVGRTGVLSECWEWAEGMRASIQRQINLMKTSEEGASDGNKEKETKGDGGGGARGQGTVVGIDRTKPGK